MGIQISGHRVRTLQFRSMIQPVASARVICALYTIYRLTNPGRKGASIMAKQLICNDCGCRFEIRDAKEESIPQTAKKDKTGTSQTRPLSLSCPECRSYNITTA